MNITKRIEMKLYGLVDELRKEGFTLQKNFIDYKGVYEYILTYKNCYARSYRVRSDYIKNSYMTKGHMSEACIIFSLYNDLKRELSVIFL